jgi:AcrR family transcriptional regulator
MPEAGRQIPPTHRKVGRPSVAGARKEQILDAVEATVTECGLENTSLQRIADRAGVTRSAIAHFVGNRDDVIDAAATRSVGRIRAEFEAALRETPPEDRVNRFIDMVFSRGRRDRKAVLDLNDELVALAHRHPHAREKLAELYTAFEDMVQDMLGDLHPEADDEQVATVAATAVLLLREADRVAAVGLTLHPDLIEARAMRAVRLLVDSLGRGGAATP